MERLRQQTQQYCGVTLIEYDVHPDQQIERHHTDLCLSMS